MLFVYVRRKAIVITVASTVKTPKTQASLK